MTAPPTRETHLPRPLTRLIGRDAERREIVGLLREERVRLLTLTGPGGVGKTRLAVQVAADLVEDFSDGVWFVDLSPLEDPALVPATIAQGSACGTRAGRWLSVSSGCSAASTCCSSWTTASGWSGPRRSSPTC